MSDPSQNKPDADDRDRALKAVELRIQGHPYAQIADRLGYADESGARHAVQRNLDRREAESIDEMRAVHSARLEGVLSAFWAAAVAGDTDAARIVLRTLDSLAKLFGLDAPSRVALGATVGDTVDFANEAARLIESVASLGGTDDLLRSLPNGAGHAVIAEREQAALPVAVGWADDDAAEPWSNIGGPDPEPVAPSVTEPEPLTVIEADPLPVAEVEPDPKAEVTPPPVPSTPRINPWARRVSERYDPLAGWRR
jgi:hypothetical protein